MTRKSLQQMICQPPVGAHTHDDDDDDDDEHGDTGKLKPLPPLTHPLSSAAAALRQLSAARHVGKVVVQNPAGSNAGGLAHMARKGRWVVTGGLGALGSLSGRWLAQRGMAHICLLGRTGHMPSQQVSFWGFRCLDQSVTVVVCALVGLIMKTIWILRRIAGNFGHKLNDLGDQTPPGAVLQGLVIIPITYVYDRAW